MACHQSIPARLYTNDRAADQAFGHTEKLFIRVPENCYEGGRPSLNAFTSQSQSFNREKYCEVAEDVLFNIDAENENDHFDTFGIISLRTDALTAEVFPHPQEPIQYVLAPDHDPVECMYPHSEILTFVAGDERTIRSSLVKTTIKKFYRRSCEIEKDAG